MVKLCHRSKLYGMYEEGELEAIMGMTKADKKLKDAGYEKDYENDKEIHYTSDIIILGERFKYFLTFYKNGKFVEKINAIEQRAFGLSKYEIEASYYKMKELGWI